MNYKKVLKSRNKRLFFLRLFDWIPDKPMLKIQYRIKMGRKLDLKHPRRLTEKLQWYKLYYKNPIMPKCVDKFEVRKYVKSKGLEEILTKCYGVYERFEDIDFESLPNSFVLKDTLGGGGNSVIIIENKEKMDLKYISDETHKWLNYSIKSKSPGREWPYERMKHRIIVEEYIASSKEKGGLIDYKFFCNGGNPLYLYVITDRTLGDISNFGIYDINFNKLNITRVGEKQGISRDIKKPKNYNRMVEIAKQLSNDFPHARIDLYNQDGKILFGEITFYNASGYMKYSPDSFDYDLAKGFELTKY